jgi:hypothetical protein
MMDELFTPQYKTYYESKIACHEDALDRYGNWLAGNIRMYDPDADHVSVLRDLIVEMKRVLAVINRITHTESDETRYGIDTTDLPSIPIPDGISTEYPIWAMDSNGNVLVGESLTDIESITSIILDGRYIGLGTTIQYDPDAPIQANRLPEPIRSWYQANDGIGEDEEGFVHDLDKPGDDKRLTWEEVVVEYGYQVWDINP